MLKVNFEDGRYLLQYQDSGEIIATVQYGQCTHPLHSPRMEVLDECLVLYCKLMAGTFGYNVLEIVDALQHRDRHPTLCHIEVETQEGWPVVIRYHLCNHHKDSLVAVELRVPKVFVSHGVPLLPKRMTRTYPRAYR